MELDNINNGLKISEMFVAHSVNSSTTFPIVKDGMNYQVDMDKLREFVGFLRITSDLTISDANIASSSKAANALQQQVTVLRNFVLTIDSDVNGITETLDDIQSRLNDVVEKAVQSDWSIVDNNNPSYIRNKPQLLKGDTGERGPQGIQGPQGIPGKDGRDGIDGKDGNPGLPGPTGASSYTHIQYSVNSNGNPMSQVYTNQSYIGILVTSNPNASSNYADYTWSRIKGAQGEDGTQGIPGTNGENGQTTYVHIKWGVGRDESGTIIFTENGGEEPGPWIGILTNFDPTDSSNPNDYTWSYIKGTEGAQGPITVFMGLYNSSVAYVGSSVVRHIVRFNDGSGDHYYITNQASGEFSGIDPTNTIYWSRFEVEYKNIATEFLFAEGANIAGWIFAYDFNNNPILRSQDETNGEPNSTLNGKTGYAHFAKKNVVFNEDGSGYLANNNISWDVNGNPVFVGTVTSKDLDNNQIVVDSLQNSVILKNSFGDVMGTWKYETPDDSAFGIYDSSITLNRYAKGETSSVLSEKIILTPAGIEMRKYVSGSGYTSYFIRNNNVYLPGGFVITNMPTNPNGLESGGLWNDGGYVKIAA